MPERTIERGQSSARGYPYNYGRGELTFEINSYTIDGEDDEGTPSGSGRTVDLYRHGSWETATVEGTIEIDPSTLDYVFPESERDGNYDAPGRLVVTLDCEATQDRRIVGKYALQEECTFTRTLERDEYRGAVKLTPAIVRTGPSDRGLPYAPLSDLRVADGPTWTLHVDEPPERGSGFPTKYFDFADSSLPTDLVHALSDNPADPRILVNEDIDALVEVLEAGGHSQFRSRLRDVLRRDILMMSILQLVWYTWATIAETGECEYEWQRGLLDQLSEYLFKEDLDRNEVIEKFGHSLDESSDVRAFARDLNQAVQLYVENRKYLETFIEEEAP